MIINVNDDDDDEVSRDCNSKTNYRQQDSIYRLVYFFFCLISRSGQDHKNKCDVTFRLILIFVSNKSLNNRRLVFVLTTD